MTAITITGVQEINGQVVYDNVDLDLTNGSFLIKTGGNLIIQNSTIVGTISSTNAFLIVQEDGNLILNNNTFTISISGITPDPAVSATYYLIKIKDSDGTTINKCDCTLDTSYTAGFVLADGSSTTNNLIFTNNSIVNFHSAFYISNSNNIKIDKNFFTLVSFANCALFNCSGDIINNCFKWPGHFNVGDAVTLEKCNGVNISNNYVYSGSCYGMAFYGCENIIINNNNIVGGITYAIKAAKTNDNIENTNLTVTNNFLSQNRYGLTASYVATMNVSNNYFMQRFADAETRLFWTDNNNLLANITNLTWANNLYQESYTQVNGGDNSLCGQFATFPETGGVVF